MKLLNTDPIRIRIHNTAYNKDNLTSFWRLLSLSMAASFSLLAMSAFCLAMAASFFHASHAVRACNRRKCLGITENKATQTWFNFGRKESNPGSWFVSLKIYGNWILNFTNCMNTIHFHSCSQLNWLEGEPIVRLYEVLIKLNPNLHHLHEHNSFSFLLPIELDERLPNCAAVWSAVCLGPSGGSGTGAWDMWQLQCVLLWQNNVSHPIQCCMSATHTHTHTHNREAVELLLRKKIL